MPHWYKTEGHLVQTLVIEAHGKSLQVHVHEELRSNHRVAFGKQGLVIRLRKTCSKLDKQQAISAFMDWARKQIERKPELLSKGKGRTYRHGEELNVLGIAFTINISESNAASSAASMSGRNIFLKLSKKYTEHDRQLQAGIMVSRCIGSYFLPHIRRRLRELNESHFKKQIRTVRMKNNASNWGSCSSNGNINISTRLLLAPIEVVDYVLIHELAHLVHFDHSHAYWQCVAAILPEYEQHEEWLKRHGDSCYF